MVAMVSAGLHARSFDNGRRVPTGRSSRRLLAGINLSTAARTRSRSSVHRRARRRERVPGVTGSVGEDAPLGASGDRGGGTIEGFHAARARHEGYRNLVAPDYFRVRRIGLVEGRDFTDAIEGPASRSRRQRELRGAIRAAARLGRRFSRGGRRHVAAWWRRRHTDSERAQPYFYAPSAAVRSGSGSRHVRARRPGAGCGSVRRELQQ